MRRGAWLVVALTAVSLVVAAWITTSSPTPVFTGSSQPETTQPTSRAPSGQQRPPPDQTAQDSGAGWLPFNLVVFMYILMVIFAVALLTVLVSRATRRRRRRAAADVAEPIDVDELSEEELSAGLAATVAARLTAMAAGSPRNAIVRCWIELEDAVIRAGLRRDAALTAAEFTHEVIGRLALDRGAITILSDLYREARFSEHDLTEEHRARATAALHALQDQLPSRPVAHTGPA